MTPEEGRALAIKAIDAFLLGYDLSSATRKAASGSPGWSWRPLRRGVTGFYGSECRHPCRVCRGGC